MAALSVGGTKGKFLPLALLFKNKTILPQEPRHVSLSLLGSG